MPRKKKTHDRSRFGNVREVRKGSGRWSARYTGPDHVRVYVGTFDSEEAAWRALDRRRYELGQGQLQPLDRKITLSQYIEQEYKLRRKVGASTEELYDASIRNHIVGDPGGNVRVPSPRIGNMMLDKITPSVVEKWHADREACGERACSQAYALLRTIMNMALRDRLIQFNPCQIVGAVKDPAERPFIPQEQAAALLAAMPEAHRTAFIVTLLAHLRRGELLGLQRSDVDLGTGKLTVERQVRRIKGKAVETPTKTRKARTIALPPEALVALSLHLETTAAEPDGRLFHHTNGKPLADHHLRRSWTKARGALGLGHLHFHDLRHASLTWFGHTGATTREIMYRAGHTTPRASLIYQHADPKRDTELASTLVIKAAAVSAVHSEVHEGNAKGTRHHQHLLPAKTAAGKRGTKVQVSSGTPLTLVT